MGAEGFVADHATVGLVVQAQLEAAQAGAQGEGGDVEDGVFAVAAGEQVVGDAGVEVVDVVEADVAAEPVQQGRQAVERAAAQPGGVKIPVVVAGPVDAFKIVLDVEQPHARRGAKGEDGHLDQQVGFPADEVDEQGDDARQGQVGPQDAVALAGRSQGAGSGGRRQRPGTRRW